MLHSDTSIYHLWRPHRTVSHDRCCLQDFCHLRHLFVPLSAELRSPSMTPFEIDVVEFRMMAAYVFYHRWRPPPPRWPRSPASRGAIGRASFTVSERPSHSAP